MKAKLLKAFALAGILFSFFLIGLSFTTPAAYAEEESETPNPIIAEADNSEVLDAISQTAEKTAMDNVVAWAVGIINLLVSTGIIAKVSLQKRQSVAVTVNDSDTQKKLDILAAENSNLKEAMLSMINLQKGTHDVINVLFANNPNLDDKIKNVINEVSLNSESIVKDVKDVFGAENKKKVTEAIKAIGNVVLG